MASLLRKVLSLRQLRQKIFKSSAFKENKPVRIKSDDSKLASPLLRLPPDLILCIADHLNEEFRVPLGLATKYLYAVLITNTNTSPKLSSLQIRNRFLSYLETDLPEYLTCEACGLLYSWRDPCSLFRRCPRFSSHSTEMMLLDRSNINTLFYDEYESININPSMVRLFLRAYRRGPKHGLPISLLDKSFRIHCDSPCELEARIVDGQFLLRSRIEVSNTIKCDIRERYWKVDRAVCLHGCCINDIARESLDPGNGKITDKELAQTFPNSKCPHCPTDFRVSLKESTDQGELIVVDKWQNFGTGHLDQHSNTRMYYSDIRLPLSNEELAGRDIESWFLTGSF